jgi:hypothetical protein
LCQAQKEVGSKLQKSLLELESGTKNFDDPESPPFAQILASTSKRQEDGKQKPNDAEKSRSKSSKDKNRQKQKSGDPQSGTESDKQKEAEKNKEKKPKSLDAIKASKSVDKVSSLLNIPEVSKFSC